MLPEYRLASQQSVMTGFWAWETINYLYSVLLLRLQRGWLQCECERRCTPVFWRSGLQHCWLQCELTKKPPRIWEGRRSLKWLAIPFNRLPADWKQVMLPKHCQHILAWQRSPKLDFKKLGARRSPLQAAVTPAWPIWTHPTSSLTKPVTLPSLVEGRARGGRVRGGSF